MDDRIALIVANGESPSPEVLDYLWNRVDLCVACDGGALVLSQQGKVPHWVVGDLDSLSPQLRTQFSPQTFIHIPEQETNDLDKAVRFCLQQKVQTIHVLGATGKRCDHFLANLEVMYKYSSQLLIVMWNAQEYLRCIHDYWEDQVPLGATLSLSPLFGGVEKITTQGLVYPLKQQPLLPGRIPIGLSNQVLRNPVSIRLSAGCLVLSIQQGLAYLRQSQLPHFRVSA